MTEELIHPDLVTFSEAMRVVSKRDQLYRNTTAKRAPKRKSAAASQVDILLKIEERLVEQEKRQAEEWKQRTAQLDKQTQQLAQLVQTITTANNMKQESQDEQKSAPDLCQALHNVIRAYHATDECDRPKKLRKVMRETDGEVIAVVGDITQSMGMLDGQTASCPLPQCPNRDNIARQEQFHTEIDDFFSDYLKI
mmetsp:Transcript_19064/g.21234  ORF Transcript_19064/g.21234 Transcript_19064/m.21234 type:complete len:195 (+) Transcript_19064:165-749(+)